MALEKFHYTLDSKHKITANRMAQMKINKLRPVLKILEGLKNYSDEDFASGNIDSEIIFELFEHVFDKKNYNILMENATLPEAMTVFMEWAEVNASEDDEEDNDTGK